MIQPRTTKTYKYNIEIAPQNLLKTTWELIKPWELEKIQDTRLEGIVEKLVLFSLGTSVACNLHARQADENLGFAGAGAVSENWRDRH